ncbi:MAG TPA: chemotaxis protein CheB [Oligoflexus sp.]|uniref:chemotaxis protein CheB n=1 Tax=Oligoflexus sp. TaxID=1971216 RepID=UPI002D36B71F|nr:chemotaxis protein CheB [Oligoflexus sp.]HYX34366.1 chemotaxis protein CheB [Oligoflexus sp.]
MKLNTNDIETIYVLAEKLTGSHQHGRYRKDILVSNVERRMGELNLADLNQYLRIVATESMELQRLISSLTIHTTSWFRENAHFEELAQKFSMSYENQKISIVIAACSTGQETYSLGLVLESLRELGRIADYELISNDIDSLVVLHAKAAQYASSELNQIPTVYHRFLVKNDKTKTFTVSNQITRRCRFLTCDLRDLKKKLQKHSFHLVLCRNVLIYFHSSDIPDIIDGFDQLLIAQGYICLGTNELIDIRQYPQLEKSRNSLYRKKEAEARDHALFHPDVLLFGASTGGTSALLEILADMPSHAAPVVVVQHINEHFAADFARRLAEVSKLKLYEESYPAPLLKGHLYMSLTTKHITLKRQGRNVKVELIASPAVNRHIPSVDVLFQSTTGLPLKIMATLLTGMGVDGAAGLDMLKKQGAYTMAQDEDSCTVYGMPRSAIDRGAACLVGDLKTIRRIMLKALLIPE